MFLSRISGLLKLSVVRQTLWLLALFFLVSLIAWGGTYFLVQREMLQAVDARLKTRMEAAVAALDSGETLPEPGNGETSMLFTATERRDGFETRDLPKDTTEMRYFAQSTRHGQIELGENTERQEELRDILAGGMQLSLVATLLISSLAGLWMAKRSQERLSTINDGLAKVARGDLATRINLEGQDDLSLLAERIDATTARLEMAMTQMRVQSSNIAHDLRTPLARLRAEIESNLLACTEQDRPVLPEVLESALDQIDRITDTFEALLRLARIESGAGREAFTPVDLGDLVDFVGETFGPVVENAGQVLKIEKVQPAQVQGDHDLLVQLLANLIQNALRHGAQTQTIALQVHGPRLIVSDEGPGIPFADRDAVLQPLYQGQTTRQTEGFGLGLSLVRAITELHGADLSLSDGPNGHGLTVTVRFAKVTEL